MDFGKTMKALSRKVGTGRITLELAESGRFYARAYRTREQAMTAFREKMAAEDTASISIDDLTASIEKLYDKPLATGTGQGAEGAIADLRSAIDLLAKPKGAGNAP